MTTNASPSVDMEPPAVPTAQRIPFDRIPLVDFGTFGSGSREDRRAVARAIDTALSEVGFFYLANHGVPDGLVGRVLEQARWFFGQPDAIKQSVSASKTTNRRGWFAIGEENVDPLHTRDLKEGFDIGFEGPEPVEPAATEALRGRNLWPADAPRFRSDLEAYYAALADLGRRLCGAFALAMDLPEDTFERNIETSDSRLRLLSYPPQPGPVDEAEMGAGAHTDCGCLTILSQDSLGGLQARNAAGHWIAIDPIPGTLICNVGDLMQQWSSNRYSSTVHRVVNQADERRHSAAFFFNPSFDILVERFESLVGDATDGPQTQTAGEYFSCCFSEIRGCGKTGADG